MRCTYDLVSRGKNTAGQNECYGDYDYNNLVGWGPAYQNSCLHSDSNNYSGGNTVWYNYTLATAGTIIDENTSSSSPVTNMNTATESVCPNGWTLPTTKQIDANRDDTNFNPVVGGGYYNGSPGDEATHGFWWGSEAYNGGERYRLGYRSNASLYTGSEPRRNGRYIRCVSEEKAITSLTYMQDMTPQFMAFNLVFCES